MKSLSKKTIETIKRVAQTGKLFNIDVFIIDRNGIRAKSDASYIFLFDNTELDFLEFDSLCISKMSEFYNRLSFMDQLNDGDFSIDLAATKELDSGDILVSKLGFRAGKTFVEIGCANASRYKLPSKFDDNDVVSFTIKENDINVIKGFSRVVQNKNKTVNIKSIDGTIVLAAADNEGDTATHILTSNPKYYDETNTDFSFIFSTTNILPMLRNTDSIEVTLTERGMLSTKVNGISVIIFPEKISL